MLAVLSIQVRADLMANTSLLAVLTKGANGIRPLMAEAEDGDSFTTYFLSYHGFETKDNAAGYQLMIQSWAKDYDTSLAIADQVTAALSNSENYYKYVSAEPKYNEQEEVYTQQVFEIKQ